MTAIKFSVLGIYLFISGCSASTTSTYDNVKQWCLSLGSEYRLGTGTISTGKNQSQNNEYCSCVSSIVAGRDMPSREHISDIFEREKSGTDLTESIYEQQLHGLNILEAQVIPVAIGVVLQGCSTRIPT